MTARRALHPRMTKRYLLGLATLLVIVGCGLGAQAVPSGRVQIGYIPDEFWTNGHTAILDPGDAAAAATVTKAQAEATATTGAEGLYAGAKPNSSTLVLVENEGAMPPSGLYWIVDVTPPNSATSADGKWPRYLAFVDARTGKMMGTMQVGA